MNFHASDRARIRRAIPGVPNSAHSPRGCRERAPSIPRNPSCACEDPGMARNIRVTGDDEATGDCKAVYDAWRKASGRSAVPGILKCFSARPDFLQQVIDFSNGVHFSKGHLDRRTKELIASYVSALNRCEY
jgi:hypothetical protein